MRVTISFHNPNPSTIWNRLAARLGREPTNAEAREEVERILLEAHCTRAEQGKLDYQRKR